jgi:hypothetical protein
MSNELRHLGSHERGISLFMSMPLISIEKLIFWIFGKSVIGPNAPIEVAPPRLLASCPWTFRSLVFIQYYFNGYIIPQCNRIDIIGGTCFVNVFADLANTESDFDLIPNGTFKLGITNYARPESSVVSAFKNTTGSTGPLGISLRLST